MSLETPSLRRPSASNCGPIRQVRRTSRWRPRSSILSVSAFILQAATAEADRVRARTEACGHAGGAVRQPDQLIGSSGRGGEPRPRGCAAERAERRGKTNGILSRSGRAMRQVTSTVGCRSSTNG